MHASFKRNSSLRVYIIALASDKDHHSYHHSERLLKSEDIEDMSNLIAQVFQAAKYIQPIHFFLAITTNILNIRILCSRALRFSPCTHYFLAYAIFSILYTCVLCSSQMSRGFSFNWANGKVTCKVEFYILFLLPFQANLMLILSSFDRYCSSSQSRLLNSASTIKKARIFIVSGTLLCVVYISPILVIYEWNAVTNVCLPKSSTLINIYIFSQIVVYYILEPILLLLFGLLTISNIHRQRTVVVPLATTRRARRTEGQLARMLLLQVGVHLIFALPYGVTYCMSSFFPSTQTPTVIGVRSALVMWQQCDYFISFFLYILSGRVYREQLIQILRSIKCSEQ
jgi:hypothetical protein